MPIASELATAAHIYRLNDALLPKSIAGLTAEELQRRPNDTTNSMLWIVGHTVWARSMAIKLLGSSWTRPWLSLFARGAKPSEQSEYPPIEEMVLGWQDASATLTAALEQAPAEVLCAPAPEKSPASMERTAEWSASSHITRPTMSVRPPTCGVGWAMRESLAEKHAGA